MSNEVEEIRDQLVKGDQSYLKIVFQESYAYTTSYLQSKRLIDKEEAHDLFIDSILILRKKIIAGGITQITNLKGLMVGICLNLNKELVKKKSKIRKRENQVREFLYKNDYEVDDYSENSIIVKKRICKSAIQSLGEQCQELIRLYHYESFTMIEIAKFMGFASPNVAKTLKSRCYQKFIKEAKRLRAQME